MRSRLLEQILPWSFLGAANSSRCAPAQQWGAHRCLETSFVQLTLDFGERFLDNHQSLFLSGQDAIGETVEQEVTVFQVLCHMWRLLLMCITSRHYHLCQLSIMIMGKIVEWIFEHEGPVNVT